MGNKAYGAVVVGPRSHAGGRVCKKQLPLCSDSSFLAAKGLVLGPGVLLVSRASSQDAEYGKLRTSWNLPSHVCLDPGLAREPSERNHYCFPSPSTQFFWSVLTQCHTGKGLRRNIIPDEPS